jgi:aminoglycoside phosphotransferase (APT) family kinase protein
LREGKPVGIIDFDAAAPGERLQDVGYALFLWLNLGSDGRQSPNKYAGSRSSVVPMRLTPATR